MPLHVSRSLPEIPPGPTDYSPSKPLRVSPKASFTRSRRWSDVDEKRGPGPTDYYKTQRANKVMWSQPRQPRFSSVPRGTERLPPINPGPADYSPKKALTPGHKQSFGRSKRWDEEPEPREAPGPGWYRKTKAEFFTQKAGPRQPKFSEVPRGYVPGGGPSHEELMMAKVQSALL
mmetsp:Transcript_91232/g.204212  ORF Transcript_91232/g.204212 Transcript_91232/m.204212 type:complete len:175 (-) Transcript_91232:114-638(-)